MRTVAEFRKHAEECREMAKRLTREAAMELMAKAWDKAAGPRARAKIEIGSDSVLQSKRRRKHGDQ
jgi:hypothetical protein